MAINKHPVVWINPIRVCSMLLAYAFFAFSCAGHKPARLPLDETEAWKLSYRMVKSNILGETELGIRQFDSLLLSQALIEPKIMSAGLELLHKRGEHQRVREIFRQASKEARRYVCQSGWAAQSPDSLAISLCTQVDVQKQTPTNPQLQKELAIMLYNDQAVRAGDKSALLKEFGLSADSVSYNLDGVATDALNREKLKSILTKYGFPGKAMVGEAGMDAVFFIIQHADMDKEFQKSQLPFIEAAVKKGDLDGQKYAYLYDRIKINAGEPQLYGTQFSRVDAANNIAELAPVKDLQNLDARRKEIGMMPIQIYKELMVTFSKKQTVN